MKLCTLGVFALGGELSFLNCDDIFMCVVNKQFELLEFVFDSAYVLWMDVVRGMRGVGGVCEMCMCLAEGGVGGEGCEWLRGLGLGFMQPVGTGEVLIIIIIIIIFV